MVIWTEGATCASVCGSAGHAVGRSQKSQEAIFARVAEQAKPAESRARRARLKDEPSESGSAAPF